jgi:diacylglycerol kinase (ATP)
MQSRQPFTFRKQRLSFYYAGKGIAGFFRFERNARLHLLAAVVVIAASFYFRISSVEAVLVAISIGFVWMAEMFNTCIEKLIDFISLEKLPMLGSIKDLSAGAVLIASITALITALIIFIPKIFP